MFNNKIEKFSIRKTKTVVASVLTGLLFLGGTVITNNSPSSLVYANEVTAGSEIAKELYTITGNVDVKNELVEGTDSSNKTHTSQVEISLKDTSTIREGDYITFEVDGFDFFPNGTNVSFQGTIIGRLTPIEKLNAVDLATSNDLNEVNKIQDGTSSNNENAKYRLVFNKNIERFITASLRVSNTGSQYYAPANHDHTEVMSIKDVSGTILSSKSFLVKAASRNDSAVPYVASSLNEFKVYYI